MLFTLALTWAGVVPPDLTVVLALDCVGSASLVWLCWHTGHCLGKRWASPPQWPNGPSVATHGVARKEEESELHSSQVRPKEEEPETGRHIPEKLQLQSPRPRKRIQDSPVVKPAKPPVKVVGPARTEAERARMGKESHCQVQASAAGDVILEGVAETEAANPPLGYGVRKKKTTRSSGLET